MISSFTKHQRLKKDLCGFCKQTVDRMREIVHIQAGQCGNQIGAKVRKQLELRAIFIFSTFNTCAAR